MTGFRPNRTYLVLVQNMCVSGPMAQTKTIMQCNTAEPMSHRASQIVTEYRIEITLETFDLENQFQIFLES